MPTTSVAKPGQANANATQTKRILVLDNIADEGLQMLTDAEGIEFEVKTGLAGEELRQALEGFHGAVCRSGVKITAESLEGNTTLAAIARAGVGTDNIDKEAATRKGIVVMNTPAGNTVSTAEHAMALMLGLSRNVAPAHASLKAGRWDRKIFKGAQLQGKTLGVVGLGRIGQEVAKRAMAFGMHVVGFDPFLMFCPDFPGLNRAEMLAPLRQVTEGNGLHWYVCSKGSCNQWDKLFKPLHHLVIALIKSLGRNEDACRFVLLGHLRCYFGP